MSLHIRPLSYALGVEISGVDISKPLEGEIYSRIRLVVWMMLVGVLVLGADSVSGQTTSTGSGQAYPSKLIRIVTSERGGSIDFLTRVIAQELSGPLAQQLIVDNRPSAITGEIVSKAPPDGYTLLLAGSTLLITPLLIKTPYDPLRDFAPITLASTAPNILLVHPSLPVKSVKDLIALAKAKPGELNYAATTPGGAIRIAAELFKSMAGIDVVGVNYKGAGAALTAMLSGEAQLIFSNLTEAAPHVKSGRLRALAVTSLRPSALARGLPTIAESGLPGFETGTIFFLVAPAKTPESVIKRLNQEVLLVLNRQDIKEKFLNNGVEAVGSSPDELAATMKAHMARIGKVIKDAGISDQ